MSPWVLIVAVVVAFAAGWFGSRAVDLAGVAVRGIEVSPTPTATPTSEPDTEDDAIFVDLVTRDIDDFAKDLGDMSTTLDENGYWRLLSNTVELNFNLTQLEGHEEPASIAPDWNDALDQLGEDLDQIESGVTARSESETRAAIADARETIAKIREIVSRVD